MSSLQELLDEEQPYPAIRVDGSFGWQTQEAVMDFQSAHYLTPDGVVASETANALNKFAPRPSVLSYAAGFVDSRLALPAKLCVMILAMFTVIICLLLRAARTGPVSLLRIRCALAGLFAGLIAANSAAMEILIAQAHGWVAKFLCLTLTVLTAALIKLITEMFPKVSARESSSDAAVLAD